MMDDRRIFGILLLVLGVVLLVIGTGGAHAASSRLSEGFQFGPSDKAVWLIFAGGILGVIGLAETTRRRRAT